MSNSEFLKWTTSEADFYDLLGITFESCSASELRRAYRKTALKYHPDKVGKDFDPDKYELFQAANEVLSDPELKAKYDNHRNAKLQKQRANELFEGKRRQMKEELEAREKAGGNVFVRLANGAGVKRPRSEDEDIRRMAEVGRQKRAEMARKTMMAEKATSSPAPRPAPAPIQQDTPSKPQPPPVAEEEEEEEEDDIARLERKIRDAEAAKAKRKSDKKARKSGVFVPSDSPSVSGAAEGVGESAKMADRETSTPIKRPDIFRGLKADEKSSASPKFSFSPSIPTPTRNDFAATMARLKAAEKQRLEEQIREQEAETTE